MSNKTYQLSSKVVAQVDKVMSPHALGAKLTLGADRRRAMLAPVPGAETLSNATGSIPEFQLNSPVDRFTLDVRHIRTPTLTP